jgi:hypothetical protein
LPGIIETLNKVFLLGILLIGGTVLVIGLVQSWRTKNHNITLASFTDSCAATGADTSGALGHFITDMLEFELRRIAQFHMPTHPSENPRPAGIRYWPFLKQHIFLLLPINIEGK